MPQYAKLPNGEYAAFPDDWQKEQIDEVVYRDFADLFPAQEKPWVNRGLDFAGELIDTVTGKAKEYGQFAAEVAVPPTELPPGQFDSFSGAGLPVTNEAQLKDAQAIMKPTALPTAREQMGAAGRSIAPSVGKFGTNLADFAGEVVEQGLLGATGLVGLGGLDPYIRAGRETFETAVGIPQAKGAIDEALTVPNQVMSKLPPGAPGRGVIMGTQSAAQTLPSFLMGPQNVLKLMFSNVTGGAIDGTKQAFESETPGMLVEYLKEKGFDGTGPAPLALATGYGLGEIVVENPVIEKLFSKWGKNWKGELAKIIAMETGQETLVTTIEAGLDKIISEPDLSMADFEDRLKDLYASLPVALAGTIGPAKAGQALATQSEEKKQENLVMQALQRAAEERARQSLDPQRAQYTTAPQSVVSPQQTAQRPGQVGPPAAAATGRRIQDENLTAINTQIQDTQQRAREETAERNVIDEMLADQEQARTQRAQEEADRAYAQRQKQTETQRQQEERLAREQKAEQDVQTAVADAEGVERYQQMGQEFDENRRPALGDALENALRAQEAPADGVTVGKPAEANITEPAPQGRVQLVHFSKKEGLQELDPQKYGTGVRGAELKRKQNNPDTWVDRTHYFMGDPTPTQKDAMLGSQRYEVDIDATQLYDAKADPDGLREQARDNGRLDTTLYENLIQKAGYKGYWVDDPGQGRVAVVYDKMPTRQVQTDAESVAKDTALDAATDWSLRRMPLSSVKPTEEGAEKYRGRENDPRPIKVDEKGRILDGHHRYAAALRRGDTDVEVLQRASEVGQGTGRVMREEKGDAEQSTRAEAQPVRERGRVPGGPGVQPAQSETSAQGREADGSLKGLPRIKGAKASKPIADVARKYVESRGQEYSPPSDYAQVDEARATRIAELYDQMQHDPQNPEVREAFEALVEETIAQYEAVMAAGLQVEFIDMEKGDPYAADPRAAIRDIVENNHMWVYSTRDGFGSDATFDPTDNPLLAETQFTISGRPALANDLFRVVHDYFGHAKEGVGFRAAGEENAWRAHASMFSPLARRAMTTETRGQNSWVNYGPYGEQNRSASAADTVFADQKTGLLPEWVSEQGSGQELPAMLQEQADDAIATGPQDPTQIPSFLKPQAVTMQRSKTGGKRPRFGKFYATVHSDLVDHLVMPPTVVDAEIGRDFPSTVHVIETTDEAVVNALRKLDEDGMRMSLPTEAQHKEIRRALTQLEQVGLPLQGGTLGVRFILVGDHGAQGRHAPLLKRVGNKAFISIGQEVMDDVTSATGNKFDDAQFYTNSLVFTLAHEIGHSVDVRDTATAGDEVGEKNTGWSQSSPLFAFNNTSDMGPVIGELWNAYATDRLGLQNLLHYPFGKMMSFTSTGEHKQHIQLEAFAQLFGIYYTYGRSKPGAEALREVMPQAMAFMEEIHDALETSDTTVDERDRAIREIFGRDSILSDAVDAPGRDQPGDTQGTQEQEAGTGVSDVQGTGQDSIEGLQPDPASSELLTELKDIQASGPTFMQYPDQDPGVPHGFTVPDESAFDATARKLQDKFRRLRITEEAIASQGGTLTMDNDAYKAEERFHGKVENDLLSFERDYITPLVQAMVQQKVDTDTLNQYLYARHAPERNEVIASRRDDMPDGGSGWTNAQALQVRNELEAQHPDIEQLAQQVWSMLQLKRNRMRDSSLVSDDLLDSWQDRYKYYVPLKGFAADAPPPIDRPWSVAGMAERVRQRLSKDAMGPRVGSGLSVKGKETKISTGRTTEAADILVQVMQDVTESFIRARKNEVGQALLQLVQDNPNPEFWEVYTEQNPAMQPSLRGEEVRMTPVAMAISPDFFGVKEDGNQYFIKLKDARLAQAMQNLGVEKQGLYIKVMASATRYLSAINTALDPEFVPTNWTRDIQTAVLNVLAEQTLHDGKVDTKRLARKMAKDVFKGVQSMYRVGRQKTPREGNAFDQYAYEFIEDGAKVGFYNTKDIETQKRYVESLIDMANGTAAGNARKMAKAVGDFVRDTNSAAENGVRLSAYVNARELMEKRGIDEKTARLRATNLAKNLTVNFNRRGELTSSLNATYMFFNASVQGTAQFARVMLTLRKGEDGKRRLNLAQKAAMGLTTTAYLLSILARAQSEEDDDGRTYYDNIPSSIKERNMVFMKANGKDYYKVPLPYGYNIFWNMGQNLSDVIHGPLKVSAASLNLTNAVLGSFNPIGLSSDDSVGITAFKTITPSVLTPGAELATNSNFWGGQIYKEDRYNERTPASAMSMNAKEHFVVLSKWLNEVTGGSMYERGGLDISPDAIEHVFEFVTGGLGRFVNKTAGAIEKTALGMPMEPNEIPFYRKLNGSPAKYLQSANYYEVKNQVLAKEDALLNLRGADRREFRERNEKFIPLIRSVHRADARLQSLRIQRDRKLAQVEGKKAQDVVKREYSEKMNAEYSKVNALWYKTIE